MSTKQNLSMKKSSSIRKFSDLLHDTVSSKYSIGTLGNGKIEANPSLPISGANEIGYQSPGNACIVVQPPTKNQGSNRGSLNNKHHPRITDPFGFTSREHARRLSNLSNKVLEHLEVLLNQSKIFTNTITSFSKLLSAQTPENPTVVVLFSAAPSMSEFLREFQKVHFPDFKDSLELLLAVGSTPPKPDDQTVPSSLIPIVQMYEERINKLKQGNRTRLSQSIRHLDRVLAPVSSPPLP